MITKEDTLYVTVGLSYGPDGSIGVLLPGYERRIIVRESAEEDGGHRLLHVGLAYVLEQHGQGEEP